MKNKLHYLPLFLSLFILAFLLLYPRIGLSFHGNFHLTIINQIRHKIIPPQHACLAGEPINYAWIYHFILAQLIDALSISPIQLNQILNLILFSFVILFTFKINRIIFKNRPYLSNSSSLFSLFGINILAPLYLVLNLLDNKITDLIHFKSPFNFIDLLIPFGFGDGRATGMLKKFFNFGATPSGILLVVLYLYISLKIIHHRKVNPRWLLTTSIVFLLSQLIHPFSSLFILVVLLPALVLSFWLRDRHIQAVKIAVSHLITFTATYFLYTRYVTVNTLFFLPKSPISYFFILISMYPLHIVILALFATDKNLINKLRKLQELDDCLLFLLFGTVLATFWILFVKFPDSNEYKFILYLSFLITPLSIGFLDQMISSRTIKAVYLFAVLMSLLHISLISFAYLNSRWAREPILKPSDKIYEEIRQRSEPKDIVINNQDNISDLRGGYISRRRIYVAFCSPHTVKYNSYYNRKALISKITPQDIKRLNKQFPDSNFFFISPLRYPFMEKIYQTGDKYLYLF